MGFLEDEEGQGAAEYLLLFGGVIFIAIAALLIYRAYLQNHPLNVNVAGDIQTVRTEANK